MPRFTYRLEWIDADSKTVKTYTAQNFSSVMSMLSTIFQVPQLRVNTGRKNEIQKFCRQSRNIAIIADCCAVKGCTINTDRPEVENFVPLRVKLVKKGQIDKYASYKFVEE